jgi:hypothetical protein
MRALFKNRLAWYTSELQWNLYHASRFLKNVLNALSDFKKYIEFVIVMHIFVYLGKIRSSNMQFFSINIEKFVVFNISFKCI